MTAIKQYMDKNKIILILALIATFLVTNGTFFVLCEKDIVLDYINKFGNWTNTALWHSSKAFLFYAGADTFYNIRYVAPKLAYAFAPIKWADKLNGYLGGSTLGELEKHLAQDKYCPLYKDVFNGTYTNIGLPLYNNIWAPSISFLGLKPLIIEKKVPIFVDRPQIEYRDRVERQIIEHYKDNENILSVRDSINNLQSAVVQNTLLSNGLQQNFTEIQDEFNRLDLLGRLDRLHITVIQDICRQDNEWLPTNHQLLRIVEDDEFMLSTGYAAPGLRVFYKSKSIFGNSQSEHSLLISGFWFYNTYPKIAELIDGYSTSAVANQINIRYQNNSIDSSICTFIHKDTQEEINILDFLRNNALSGLEQPQNNFDLLIERVNQRLDNIVQFGGLNQGSQTETVSENSVILNHVSEFLDEETRTSIDMLSRQDPAEAIFANSAINTSAATTMGVLGIIGTISVLSTNDLFTVFSHFLGFTPFEPLLTNPDAVKCLINIYIQATGSVPGILADACTFPNPQDYLLPGESLLEPSSPSNISNIPNPGIPYTYYIGAGIVFLGTIGVTWYLTKNGLDANPVVEAAKGLKENLQDQYVNFK